MFTVRGAKNESERFLVVVFCLLRLSILDRSWTGRENTLLGILRWSQTILKAVGPHILPVQKRSNLVGNTRCWVYHMYCVADKLS
jgi:hypothetical protein